MHTNNIKLALLALPALLTSVKADCNDCAQPKLNWELWEHIFCPVFCHSVDPAPNPPVPAAPLPTSTVIVDVQTTITRKLHDRAESTAKTLVPLPTMLIPPGETIPPKICSLLGLQPSECKASKDPKIIGKAKPGSSRTKVHGETEDIARLSPRWDWEQETTTTTVTVTPSWCMATNTWPSETETPVSPIWPVVYSPWSVVTTTSPPIETSAPSWPEAPSQESWNEVPSATWEETTSTSAESWGEWPTQKSAWSSTPVSTGWTTVATVVTGQPCVTCFPSVWISKESILTTWAITPSSPTSPSTWETPSTPVSAWTTSAPTKAAVSSATNSTTYTHTHHGFPPAFTSESAWSDVPSATQSIWSNAGVKFHSSNVLALLGLMMATAFIHAL